MTGLASLVVESARRRPDVPAVDGPDGALTYRQLDVMANRFAHALVAGGAVPGDRVGVWLDKSPQTVALLQGVLRAGCAYVPVDPSSPPRRAAVVLDDCCVRIVVTTQSRAHKLDDQSLDAAVLTVETIDLDAQPEIPVQVATRADDDLAYILYTSGSTGRPKGVCISHRNALAFVEWAADAVGATADDRFASHAPFHFDLSVFDLYVSFLSGACIVLVPEQSAFLPQALIGLIAAEKVTVWYSVPTIITMMVDAGLIEQLDPLPLRVLVFAGEPFPVAPLRRLRQGWSDVRLFNFYGPTETNVCTAYEVAEVDDARTIPVPIGGAASGDEMWAETDAGGRAAVGEEGELVVTGPTVMLGYWGHEPHRGPYRTGDIVRVLDGGIYEYIGRRDHMVKVRGYRVELGEIEAALLTLAQVRAAAVAVIGSGLRARLVAFVVVDGELRPSLLRLKRHCADRLPRYMIVDEVRYLEALPRTANGKLDRSALNSNPAVMA